METRERENQTACISFQDTLPLSFQKKNTFYGGEARQTCTLTWVRDMC